MNNETYPEANTWILDMLPALRRPLLMPGKCTGRYMNRETSRWRQKYRGLDCKSTTNKRPLPVQRQRSVEKGYVISLERKHALRKLEIVLKIYDTSRWYLFLIHSYGDERKMKGNSEFCIQIRSHSAYNLYVEGRGSLPAPVSSPIDSSLGRNDVN